MQFRASKFEIKINQEPTSNYTISARSQYPLPQRQALFNAYSRVSLSAGETTPRALRPSALFPLRLSVLPASPEWQIRMDPHRARAHSPSLSLSLLKYLYPTHFAGHAGNFKPRVYTHTQREQLYTEQPPWLFALSRVCAFGFSRN